MYRDVRLVAAQTGAAFVKFLPDRRGGTSE